MRGGGRRLGSVGAPFDFGVESPFDYEYIIDGKVSGGGYINRHRRTMISRIDLSIRWSEKLQKWELTSIHLN